MIEVPYLNVPLIDILSDEVKKSLSWLSGLNNCLALPALSGCIADVQRMQKMCSGMAKVIDAHTRKMHATLNPVFKNALAITEAFEALISAVPMMQPYLLQQRRLVVPEIRKLMRLRVLMRDYFPMPCEVSSASCIPGSNEMTISTIPNTNIRTIIKDDSIWLQNCFHNNLLKAINYTVCFVCFILMPTIISLKEIIHNIFLYILISAITKIPKK